MAVSVAVSLRIQRSLQLLCHRRLTENHSAAFYGYSAVRIHRVRQLYGFSLHAIKCTCVCVWGCLEVLGKTDGEKKTLKA